MEIIIFVTLLLGASFYVYVILKNRRKRNNTISFTGVDDRPRVIQLPKDLEKEKKRRHIH